MISFVRSYDFIVFLVRKFMCVRVFYTSTRSYILKYIRMYDINILERFMIYKK